MDFLKSAGGKVLSGVVTLAVVAAGISWWRMDEATRDALLSGTGKVVSWLGIVLLLPWATFFLIGRVGRADSNAVMADWNFYLAYNMFRLAGILQGIAKRVETGTASSAQARQASAGARPLAQMGWALAQSA